MSALRRLTVQNYRALRSVEFEAGPINVIFGPNGAGKTTLLDALWFLRDSVIESPEFASSERHHGKGVLTDGTPKGDAYFRIGIESSESEYTATIGYTEGRIELRFGERLRSLDGSLEFINRSVGSQQATIRGNRTQIADSVMLPTSEEVLALRWLNLVGGTGPEVYAPFNLLLDARRHESKRVDFAMLRKYGSETRQGCELDPKWVNLWSVLRNLHGLQAIESRYQRIREYMAEAFESFDNLLFEQIGLDRTTARILEKQTRQSRHPSGVSDGQLQLLGLLTALFAESRTKDDSPEATPKRDFLLLFDEPETSLHPHAIAVFAKAVKEAAKDGRQVFIATHSPVLLSQFEPNELILAEADAKAGTRLTRCSDIEELRDLLEEYSLGSLYMAEAVGRQGAVEA